MTEAELDAVFLALASSTRRQLLDLIADQPGTTLGKLAEQFEMSRIGLLKHLNVLQDAGLVLSEKVGRERPLYFNPVPLQLIHERWDDQYRSFWANQLTRLKYAVEQGTRQPDDLEPGSSKPSSSKPGSRNSTANKPVVNKSIARKSTAGKAKNDSAESETAIPTKPITAQGE